MLFPSAVSSSPHRVVVTGVGSGVVAGVLVSMVADGEGVAAIAALEAGVTDGITACEEGGMPGSNGSILITGWISHAVWRHGL